MGSTSVPSFGQLWEGRTIDGKYALLEWLGGSTTHGVFVTLRQGLHRAVIKIILADGADADAYIAQWESARSLSHRHLMPIFDTGRYTLNGTSIVYIVTEAADRVLSQFIDDRPLKPREATNILYPIVEALSYLHAKGFVHGHVKPSNILVAGDELKLSTDNFRLAAGVPNRLGDPSPYDAPEVAVGILTPAADVWSLSITLVEALTQQRPEWDSTTNAPPEIPQSLPLPFADFVPDCLRINPTARCILSDIKAKLAPPAPAQPMPSPEELAARAARPHVYAQAVAEPAAYRAQHAPEPAYHAPISIDAADVQLSGKWRSDEPIYQPAPHKLFADIEDANLTGRSKTPLFLGIMVILAIAAFVLLQAGFITIPPIFSKPSSASASPSVSRATPATAAPVPAPAPGATPTGESATPLTPTPTTQTASPATTTTPAPSPAENAIPGQAPVQTPAPPAPSALAQQTPAQSAPGQPAAAPPTAAQQPPMTGQSTPDTPHDTPAPRPRNAEGEVAKRVMPSASSGALSSMRAPVVVTLRVMVNRNGSVQDAAYVSPGPGNYFAKIAHRAALDWKFNPPLSEGRPQPSSWDLRFYFSRSNIEANAEERLR